MSSGKSIGGIANIQNRDSINAESVDYDDSLNLYPPTVLTVEDALDYLAGAVPPAVAEMTPTVAGTAYGLQDVSTVSNLLGRDVNGTAVSSTGRYQAQIASTSQQASYNFSIFDENHCLSDGATTLATTIVLANNSEMTNTQLSDCTCEVNNSLLNDTVVNNALVYGNAAELHDGATVRNDALYVNDSHLKAAQLDQACLHVTGLTADGISFDGAVMMGSMTNAAVTNMRESTFIASNSGAVINQNGSESLYLGNQSLGETVTNRQAWISSYDRFFLRTLRSDAAPTDVVHYDPTTAEITYGPVPTAPAYVLPAKLPTVLGGQYGINSLANNSEVNGRNSFNNYSAGPVSLSGVTAVGQQLYQASVPGTNNFTNDIFLGRAHQFPNAGTIQNSLIAATITGNAGISGINESNMIVPRAASLLLNYSGACTGANFFSSNVVTCTSDPTYSCVFSSGGTVNPATSNLVLAQQQNGGTVTMAGSGNTLISSSNAAVTYNWPAGNNNCTVIRSGAGVVTPSASNQLGANHTSFLMPNIAAVGTAGNTTTPLAFNSATGLISPTLSPLLSRIYRAVGTTGATGQVTFTPGSGVDPSTVGYSFNATVRNASTTVAYTCSINAVSATSVTVQVFNSVTVVLASPSMTASGAGIIVQFQMAY